MNMVRFLVKNLGGFEDMRMARNVYHRKDGRFEGRYVKGYGEDGKKKYGSVFGKTYAEVKEKLARVTPVTAAVFTPSNAKTTVVGAVTAHLESLKHQIKPSTQGAYQRYLNNHITPYFGNTRCDSLTPEMVQNFINTQAESGLSAVTVQSVFSFLKAGVKSANNSVFDVKLPKKPRSVVEYFSFDEQKRLESAERASCGMDYLAITISLYTGVRIGKLCGLLWSDIDFDCRVLRVRRTMQSVRSNGEAKTEIAFHKILHIASAKSPCPDGNFRTGAFVFGDHLTTSYFQSNILWLPL
jgi:integrase